MKITIPNIKYILRPRWAHKPGYWMSKVYVLKKQKKLGQGTTPDIGGIIKNIGLKKGERVLAIAGYYADWASVIAKAGAKVDYSDISRTMVNYTKKKYGKLFNKYICSNYELIPRYLNEYDWTFTYEACGGGSGLPIAYLRSLMNKKGGILVLFFNKAHEKKMGTKPKNYSKIVHGLAKIYNVKYSIKKINLYGKRKIKRKSGILPFIIYTLRTNSSARTIVKQDLEVLEKIGCARRIFLENISKDLNVDKKSIKESLKRIGFISGISEKKFTKQVDIR
jgi:hypothetical protein